MMEAGGVSHPEPWTFPDKRDWAVGYKERPEPGRLVKSLSTSILRS
jgi:hypothetical protein